VLSFGGQCKIHVLRADLAKYLRKLFNRHDCRVTTI